MLGEDERERGLPTAKTYPSECHGAHTMPWPRKDVLSVAELSVEGLKRRRGARFTPLQRALIGGRPNFPPIRTKSRAFIARLGVWLSLKSGPRWCFWLSEGHGRAATGLVRNSVSHSNAPRQLGEADARSNIIRSRGRVGFPSVSSLPPLSPYPTEVPAQHLAVQTEPKINILKTRESRLTN